MASVVRRLTCNVRCAGSAGHARIDGGRPGDHPQRRAGVVLSAGAGDALQLRPPAAQRDDHEPAQQLCLFKRMDLHALSHNEAERGAIGMKVSAIDRGKRSAFQSGALRIERARGIVHHRDPERLYRRHRPVLHSLDPGATAGPSPGGLRPKHPADAMACAQYTKPRKRWFGRDTAAGKSGAEMTEWVRSMERPLLNSKAYLDEE